MSANPMAFDPSAYELAAIALHKRLGAWKREGYMMSIVNVDPREAIALKKVTDAARKVTRGEDYHTVRSLVDDLAARGPAAGGLSKVMALSCLAMLCDLPDIARDAEAEQHIAGMEGVARAQHAIDGDDATLRRHLSAAARHRGNCCLRRNEVRAALDHFILAVDLQPTPQNHQNVLCALVKLDLPLARSHLASLQASLTPDDAACLTRRIDQDNELWALKATGHHEHN